MKDAAPTTDYRLSELRAVFERRMDSLERARGRQDLARWLGPALGALALLVASFAAVRTTGVYRVGTVSPALVAGSFVLRDEDGVDRAAIGLLPDGEASLTLTDRDGRSRLRLSVLPDGSPGVSLLDSQGESRAILGLLPDGTTTLVLADPDAIARGVLALTPDGAARMVFSDRGGVTRTAVGIDAEGNPEVSTMDAAEDGAAPSGD